MTRVVVTCPAIPEPRENVVDDGLNIDQIVKGELPEAKDRVLDGLRVTVCNGTDIQLIPREMWHVVRPKNGRTVVILVPPQFGALLSVAQSIATSLTIGAINLGVVGLGGASTFYTASTVLVGAGFAAAASGALNINAPGVSQRSTERGYNLTGWSNRAAPGEPFPLPLGSVRVAPVFAAQPYSEVVGDNQDALAMFCFGYGPLRITDLRIGDTPIGAFEHVTTETREGRADDEPLSIIREQVIEERSNVELARGGSAQIFTTASNAERAAVIFHWPNGLRRFDSDGDLKTTDVTIRVDQRIDGGSTWTTVSNQVYGGRQTEQMFRKIAWQLPYRGRWQIRIYRTDFQPNTNFRINTTHVFSVQSIRPEYPIAFDAAPLSLAAVRARATNQFNGTVDSLTANVEREIPSWNGSAWVDGYSRNPADIFRYALQGPFWAKPVPDAGIDLLAIQDWAEYCTAKGLTYDHDHRDQLSLTDLLSRIASAGRAIHRHTGTKWTVVIDRERGHVSRIIGPRNSREFSGSYTYVEKPDALRVSFKNRTDNFQDAEIVIPWIGHTGPIEKIEVLELPGKTDPDEIQRETWRHMNEVEQRRDEWTVTMTDPSDYIERGDLVLLQHYSLDIRASAARVKAVSGQLVTLDDPIDVQNGTQYGLVYHQSSEADLAGNAVTLQITEFLANGAVVRVSGTPPPVGTLCHIGPQDLVSHEAIITDIEPGSDGARIVRMTNAAPNLDALADAFTPQPYDPIIGEVEGTEPATLNAPTIDDITTEARPGVYGGVERDVLVSVSGPDGDLGNIGSIVVEHRISGAWNTSTIYGPSGSVFLAYDDGDTIEVRATCYRPSGTAGTTSDIETFVVGSDADDVPADLSLSGVTITPGAGEAVIDITHADAVTTQVRIFRADDGVTLDPDADALETLNVTAGVTVTYTDTVAAGSYDYYFAALSDDNIASSITAAVPATVT